MIDLGKFHIYHNPDFKPDVPVQIMVVYCLRCGHHGRDHLPGRDGCLDHCGCRDWDPSEPTPLKIKVTLGPGYVWAPYIPNVVPVLRKVP